MPAYAFKVDYTQRTIKEARFLVDAPSQEEAYATVEEFVSKLPLQIDNEKQVKRFLVTSIEAEPVENIGIELIEKTNETA